jgi:putative ABC transport system permease protein
MMLEIFVSFLILFAIWTLSVYNFRNYNTPSGIKSDNVWAIFYNFNTDSDSLTALYQDLVKQRLRGFAEIESMAFLSICQNFEKSQKICKMGLPRLTKQIIMAHGR